MKEADGLGVLALLQTHFTEFKQRQPVKIVFAFVLAQASEISSCRIIVGLGLIGEAEKQLGGRLSWIVGKENREPFEFGNGAIVVAKCQQMVPEGVDGRCISRLRRISRWRFGRVGRGAQNEVPNQI